MSLSRVAALLIGSLIALTLWGSVVTAWTGKPQPGGSNVAPAVGPAWTSAPHPMPTPTATPTRKRIKLPTVDSAGAIQVLPPTPTPTRRSPVDRGELGPLPGKVALPCTYAAQLLSTSPAAQVSLPLGESLQVIWTMKNTGSCGWGPGVELRFAQKESMGANPLNIQAPDTPPGATAHFVTTLTPASLGFHVGYWELRAADGTLFGPGAMIVVGVTQ